MSAHCASSCNVPLVTSRTLSQLASQPSVALASLNRLSDNQIQHLSAVTQEKRKARLDRLSNNQTQRLSAEKVASDQPG